MPDVKSDSPFLQPRPLAALGLLWLAGLYLRLPVLAAPPLALDIARELGLGQADIGALTTLPLVTIAFAALPVAWLMARIGAGRTLLAGLILMALMSSTRGLADGRIVLFGATFLMGLGIAAMQTVLPSIVGQWTPRHLTLGTAIYMNGMMVGEFAGAGLTLPLVVPLADGSWRMALLLWSLPVLPIAILVALRTGRASVAKATLATQPVSQRMTWHDPVLWRLGLPLGAAVVVFYAINAYMSSVLAARDESDSLEILLFAFNLSPFAASLVSLAIGGRWAVQRHALTASGVASVLGLLGFMMLPGLAGHAATVMAGFASTLVLILLVSLPPVLVRGDAVGRLTAGITTIGYGIAFVLPLIGGALADLFLSGLMVVLAPSLVFAAAGIVPLFSLDRLKTTQER